jgi:large subunit ribosomal protein L20
MGHRRHRKVVKAAKGYRLLRNRTFKQAKLALMKAGANAYRDRKLKKRDFRSLWILRINAACREIGVSYSRFIAGLTAKHVIVNRKVLSELAIHHPEVFKKIVEFSQV